MTNKGTFLLHG